MPGSSVILNFTEIYIIIFLKISFNYRKFAELSVTDFMWLLYPTFFIHLFIRTVAIYTFQQINLFKLLDDCFRMVVNDINDKMALRMQYTNKADNLWPIQSTRKCDAFYAQLRIANEYLVKLTETHDKLRVESTAFRKMNSIPVTCTIFTGSIGIISKVNRE